jgi:hypothetical protein
MEPLIFDTTFLIDFQRERSSSPGGAHAFLAEHAEAVAYLPMTAYGEFAEGFPNRTDAAFLSGCCPSPEVSPTSMPMWHVPCVREAD